MSAAYFTSFVRCRKDGDYSGYAFRIDDGRKRIVMGRSSKANRKSAVSQGQGRHRALAALKKLGL